MALRFGEFLDEFSELAGKNVRKATVKKSPYAKLEFDKDEATVAKKEG